jgi:hypothetical protein
MRWTVAATLLSLVISGLISGLISCSAEKQEKPPVLKNTAAIKNTPVPAPMHQVIYYTLEPG